MWLASAACRPNLGGEDGESTNALLPDLPNESDEAEDGGAGEDGEADEGDEGAVFAPDPDLTDYGTLCDPTTQQPCPPDEKCTTVSVVNPNTWDQNACRPVVDAPDDVGESCTILGEPYDGLDTCARGSICWPSIPQDRCVAFYESYDDPECEPGHWPFISGDAILPLCVPVCDPLDDDACGAQGICQVGWKNQFGCRLDELEERKVVGEPCELSECTAGLVCVEGVAGCMAETCCTPVCDPAAPAECDALPGSTCTQQPQTPPESYEALGFCLAP